MSDGLNPVRQEIAEKLTELLSPLINSEGALLVNFVVLTKWSDGDGEPWRHRVSGSVLGEELPQWDVSGLLRMAQSDIDAQNVLAHIEHVLDRRDR